MGPPAGGGGGGFTETADLWHNAAVSHCFQKSHQLGLGSWCLEHDHQSLAHQLMMEGRDAQIPQASECLLAVIAGRVLCQECLGRLLRDEGSARLQATTSFVK